MFEVQLHVCPVVREGYAKEESGGKKRKKHVILCDCFLKLKSYCRRVLSAGKNLLARNTRGRLPQSLENTAFQLGSGR